MYKGYSSKQLCHEESSQKTLRAHYGGNVSTLSKARTNRDLHLLTLYSLICSDATCAICLVAGNLNLPNEDTREEWDAFIHKLNKTLDPLDLEMRHAIDEATGVKHYVLVCFSPSHYRPRYL